MSRDFTVQSIIDDVRSRGDVAVADWSNYFDGGSESAPRPAVAGPGLPEAEVLRAADAVRRWHAAQRPSDLTLEVNPGVILERRWTAIRSVGIYVPKNLVSSLIMCGVPAQVAGAERIIVCTPPSGAALVKAAATLLGIDEVWAVGGVQAIAAMAYGTESIGKVDIIVGPGGGPVNEAKITVSRDVAIDLPAGPSDIVVVADDGVEEWIIEEELAAQMEHGPDSLGHVVRVGSDLEAALRAVEAHAGEHVFLLGEQAESLAGRIRNAGAVFVGRFSPVPAGDFATGGNHVLPTGGWSTTTGGLGLETFLKATTVQRISESGLANLAPIIEAFAKLEGLPHHGKTAGR